MLRSTTTLITTGSRAAATHAAPATVALAARFISNEAYNNLITDTKDLERRVEEAREQAPDAVADSEKAAFNTLDSDQQHVMTCTDPFADRKEVAEVFKARKAFAEATLENLAAEAEAEASAVKTLLEQQNSNNRSSGAGKS